MTSSPGTARRWGADRHLSLGQLVVGLISLLIAVPGGYVAWREMRGDPPPPGTSATTPVGGPAPATAPAGPAPGTAPVASGRMTAPGPAVYLDTLSPETGGGQRAELPRELRGRDGYTHTLAIACPSNSPGDAERTVSYPLGRRYLRLEATVRPYYEIEADRASVTHVTVLAGTRQRDGTVTTREAGAQPSATMAAPRELSADVEGADVLTIRVQCTVPDGVIVLGEARLTAA